MNPRMLLATSAMAALAADGATVAPATVAPAPSPIGEFEFPNLPGTHSLDLATLPATVRMDFLKGAVRAYIQNRLNGLYNRHQKDPAVIAWYAYDEATKADALQTAVAKPTVDRPAEPDYQATYDAAVADLVAGNVRKQGSGEPKARTAKDPLVAMVTTIVVRELFNSKRKDDPTYGFLKAKAEVGADGVAYLNKLIDAKVEAGVPRADLEKMLAERYINPAKAALGQTVNKKLEALPSIL